MTWQEISLLLGIGSVAGILSGFVGVGGGIVIVPALVYMVGFSQFQAQGTSLFILSMPVVALALMNYAKSGNVHWKFGLVVAAAFVVGGYIGSKLALRLPEAWVKLIFGAIMAYVAFKMLWSGYQGITNHES
jgi:uncharacterized membrane protein YfcA